MRRALGAVVAAALLGALPLPALGCSCIEIDNPRASLAAADGAFVGTLERVEGNPNDNDEDMLRYRVEHAVKGITGATVDIPSGGNGAMCGLDDTVGTRKGLFLYRKGGTWTSSSCSTIGPERLLEAAAPLPAPNGSGRPAFVVGNSLGDHRSMLLDAQGRTLAYGAGPRSGSGDVIDIVLCPDGRRIVEALLRDAEPTPLLSIRTLDSFRVEGAVDASALAGVQGRYPTVGSMRCRSPSADRIDIVVHDSDGSSRRTFVFRLEQGAWRVIWQGDGLDAELIGSTSAVVWGPDRIDRLDLATGTLTPLHRVPDIGTVVPSPSGRLLAVTTAKEHRADRLLLVDPATGDRRATHGFEPDEEAGDPVWVDERTLALYGYRGTLVFLDHGLRVVATVPNWHARRTLAAGGHVYGMAIGGMVEATAARPTARPWVRLPDGATLAMAAIPPPTPRPPVTTTTTTTVASSTVPTTSPSPTAPPGPETAAPPMVPASSSRPWAPAAVATLLLMAVATVARRSVRRSG